MKHGVKYTLWGVVAALAVSLAVVCRGVWKLFGDEICAVRTLQKLDDSLYTFTYRGDYGFRQFLEQGGAKTDAEMARYISDFMSKGYMSAPDVKDVRFNIGCSTVQSDDRFCRSFDFGDTGQQMVIVRTYPSDGYASLSTSSFAFIGLGDGWAPQSAVDRLTALAAIYIPFDGINEKGVCVADLIELDGDTTDYDTNRPDLTIVAAIRLVLDYAATADEALQLLSQYDIHNSIGWAHHLSIADSAKSVVVEWKQGQMHITPTTIVTNHCMWEHRTNALNEESYRRMARLQALPQPTDDPAALLTLQQAAYTQWTIWSVIFQRSNLSGTWFIRRKWQQPHTLQL